MRMVQIFVWVVLCGIVAAQESDDTHLLGALERVFQRAAQKVAPSVVSIYVERDLTKPEGEESTEALRGVVRRRGGRYYTRPDAPVSGVIVGPNGFIATTCFNVRGKNVKSITVTLPDGRKFPAVRLGYDENTDIAILKIDAKDLPAVTFSDTRNLRVGQFVAVVGRAEDGRSLTVNWGIISALERLQGWCVQISAKLNYGNAGGAVVDINGNFIGIASYVSTDSVAGQNSGVGFMAPCHKLQKNLPDLLAGKRIEKKKRPFLGVVLSPDDPNVKGARVAEVYNPSPAARAGLKDGDIIVEFNKQKVTCRDDLVRAIRACKVGQKVTLKVIRHGRVIELEVVLGKASW